MVHKLRPPGLRPPASDGQKNAVDAGQNKLHHMVWALFGFVAALTLVVLVVLPFLVTERSAEEALNTAKSVQGAQPPALAVSVVRNDAEQALKDFLRLRAQPDLANAEFWAAEDWQLALKTALEGDGLYGRGHFAEALAAYKKATQQLQALLDGMPQRLSATLAEGRQSLQQNDVAAAVSAFERVLAMQPDHEQAGMDLARANVRKEILQLMVTGSQAEAMDRSMSAAEAYTAALQLDSTYAPAQDAVKRINISLTEDAFKQAMSEALQNLDRGNLGAAEKALQAAATIHPGSDAVKDGQRRLVEAQRRFRLASLRRQAEQRAASEDWSAAAGLYRKALAIDGRSLSARDGLSYAQKQSQLNAQIDHYLADTTRLSSDEPLANAQKLLQANKQIADSEPRLKAKISRLKEAVRLAMVPVELLIRSDGRTDISIYHVGRFGSFQQKQLTLRPGRYTLSGSCAGYRDVRKIITLVPETGSYTVTMRCEELI
jgi:tetratricopeptide (TPR) repeat protein